jgi:hypothetical protein
VVLVVAAILTVLLGAGIAAQAGGLIHMDTMMAAMGTRMGGYCH